MKSNSIGLVCPIMSRLVIILLLTLFFFLQPNSYSQDCDVDLKEPLVTETYEKNVPTQIDIKNFPSFQKPKENVNGLVPVDARLRLQANSFVDAKTSKVGEYFKAKVLEDFYLSAKPPMLLIPQGSWVRGRISKIKRPTLFSMSAEINLRLHQLVTPIGEVSTINASLSLQKGILNSKGLLDPVSIVDHEDQAKGNISQNNINEEPIIIPSLDEKIIPRLVSGFLTALTTGEKLGTINIGQELQVVLNKDIRLR